MSNRKTVSKGDQHIVNFAFLFGFFMPNGSLFYYTIPLVTLILALRFFKFNKSITVKYIIIAIIVVSFLVYLFVNKYELDTKSLLRNIYLIELILFFPFVRGVKIPNIYLYISLIYIFISQVSYIIGVGSVISFFNTYYPYEGDFYLYQSDFLQSKATEMSLTSRTLRLGGLFHNANQCARYLTFILSVFIIENFDTSFKSKLPFLAIFSMAIIGTGSRTGFFISILILTYYIYLKSSSTKKSGKYVYIMIIFVVASGFLYLVNSELATELRFLDYDEGLEKSFFVKGQILINYLSDDIHLLQLLFGNFSNDGLLAIQFDSEWGELIYRYGITVIIAFVVFYISVYKYLIPRHRIFLIILLWVVSSTLVLSYRASFLFLLLLSKYFSDSILAGRITRLKQRS